VTSKTGRHLGYPGQVFALEVHSSNITITPLHVSFFVSNLKVILVLPKILNIVKKLEKRTFPTTNQTNNSPNIGGGLPPSTV
jgi:hypothetical protein